MMGVMTRWLDPDEQRTWRAFLTASRALMDALDRELQRDAGMPHAYYEILVRLSEAPDRRLRMSELAELTGSSRSRLSHAAARLEASGWIRREDCPTDRRGQIAVLTDDGLRHPGRRRARPRRGGTPAPVRRAQPGPGRPAPPDQRDARRPLDGFGTKLIHSGSCTYRRRTSTMGRVLRLR